MERARDARDRVVVATEEEEVAAVAVAFGVAKRGRLLEWERVVGPDEDEEIEGAVEEASARFRLRVSIQKRLQNRYDVARSITRAKRSDGSRSNSNLHLTASNQNPRFQKQKESQEYRKILVKLQSPQLKNRYNYSLISLQSERE